MKNHIIILKYYPLYLSYLYYLQILNEKNHLRSKIGSHFTKNQDFFNRSKNLISIFFGLSKTPKIIV